MSRSNAIVWIDGRFVSATKASVSASADTLLHGVGVFETLRLVDGQAPWIERHLARLRAGAAAFGVDASRRDWQELVVETARRNRMRTGVARITVGPGLELVSTRALPRGLARECAEGISLTRSRVAWPLPQYKHTSRAPLWHAEHSAGGEVVLQGPGSRLLETSRSTLFCVTARGLITAPVPAILPGVARGIVLELAQELGIPVRQRTPRWTERRTWREVFVSNAVRGIRPVRDIDGTRWKRPTRSSLTRQLQTAVSLRLGIC